MYGKDMRYTINSTVHEGNHFGVGDAFQLKDILEYGATQRNGCK